MGVGLNVAESFICMGNFLEFYFFEAIPIPILFIRLLKPYSVYKEWELEWDRQRVWEKQWE